MDSGYKPPIKPLGIRIRDYDVIVLGTPTWWYGIAPAVLTFISSQDWHGKTVIPFQTDGGWPGHLMEDIRKECFGADIKYPMEIRFDSQGGSIMKTCIFRHRQSMAYFLQRFAQNIFRKYCHGLPAAASGALSRKQVFVGRLGRWSFG